MSNTKKYPCRCLTRIKGVKCTGRRSLRMKPDDYSLGRIPKCPSCGGTKWMIDNYRIRVEMSAKKHVGAAVIISSIGKARSFAFIIH